jgi:hypothetical protein
MLNDFDISRPLIGEQKELLGWTTGASNLPLLLVTFEHRINHTIGDRSRGF